MSLCTFYKIILGNFLLKILKIGNLLQSFHASTGGRYGTLAALCRSPSLRAIGAAMPGVSNSVSRVHRHDITTSRGVKLRQNWAAASRHGSIFVESRPAMAAIFKKMAALVVGGWLGGVGFFGGESMAVRHPFYKTRLCNNFVMTLVSTVSACHGFRAQVEDESWLETSRPNKAVACVETDVSGGRI